MLPPFSSNTMSSDTWSDIKEIQQTGDIRRDISDTSASDAQKTAASIGEDTTGGRPELAND